MPLRKPPPNDCQLELFSAIFTGIAARDTHDTLEYPFLSLSTRPRFEPIQYHGPNGVDVTVSGGKPYGIANIFDWDLMIWLLSQVRQASDNGMSVSRRVRFNRWAYLKDARRQTGGKEYRKLAATIARLKNTLVTTNLRAVNRDTVMFNWLEFVRIEKDTKGRRSHATVILPEWLFRSVCDHRLVLKLHRDYFLLTGGLERWLYRVIRKSAGNTSWQWKLRTLHVRSGSTREYKYFARDLRKIVAEKQLLDYELSLTVKNREQYVAARRIKSNLIVKPPSATEKRSLRFLRLETETYEIAKRLAPGFDVYAIEQHWLRYNRKRSTVIGDADRAFLGFCKSYAQKNPIPAR